MKWIIPLILAVAGCDALQYRGMEPSVRSFSEDPELRQYYVGVNLGFNVIDPKDPEQRKPDPPPAPLEFPVDPKVIPHPPSEPNIPW